MYLCNCKSISDREIREAVELGARTIGDLSIRLGIGVECGKCTDSINQFLDACLAESRPVAAARARPPVEADPSPAPPVPVEPALGRAAWFAIDL